MTRYQNIKYEHKRFLKISESDHISTSICVETDNIINPDFLNRATFYERKFISELLRQLKQTNLKFEINWNHILFFSKRATKSFIKKHNQLEILDLLESQENIYYRCPDFYIPRFNLAIEIDGTIHDNQDAKILKDKLRLESLSSIGVETMIIKNYELHYVGYLVKKCSEIVKYLLSKTNCKEIKKKSNSARKTLCLNRKKYRFTNQLKNSKSGISYHQYNYLKEYSSPCLRNYFAYTKCCGVTIPISLCRIFPLEKK